MTQYVLKMSNLSQLEDIFRDCCSVVKIADSARRNVDQAFDFVQKTLADGRAVYGINTGFGKLANQSISLADTEKLQRNLVLSHAAGVGESTPLPIVKLMMVCKLLSLARGYSGVRWSVLVLLQEMINQNVMPVIPKQGSVGASGDLAPLAHMAIVMIGEGDAFFHGERMSAIKAFQKAGLYPITLKAKEGLSLINGTQFSTAYALAHLFDAWAIAETSLLSAAAVCEAIMGATAPLDPAIHDIRGQQGQIDAARVMRMILSGSELSQYIHRDQKRIQDPYCIRCHPQVVGATIDLLRTAGKTLEIEANAVTDNPLIIQRNSKERHLVSGGNFHAEPVSFAADQIALALAEIGAISQRRIALIVDPTLSAGLPAFLAQNSGLHSGFMVAEVTSAALMSENKHLSHPCSTDSTPTSANQEDHVSMAAHGAVRLERMTQNLWTILGIEMLCGAQGIAYRAPLNASSILQKAVSILRQHIPLLEEDRLMANDLEKASILMRGRCLLDAQERLSL